MTSIKISNDIIPLGEFKASVSKWLKSIQSTGHPLVITQNGRPAGVLLSPAEYDDLVHQKQFLESVERGLKDADSGKIYTTEQVRLQLAERRSKWQKK